MLFATSKDCEKKVRVAAERASRDLKLSPRQSEIFVLLALGEIQKTAAEKIGISHKTVEMHARLILKKLGAKTFIHATAIALSR